MRFKNGYAHVLGMVLFGALLGSALISTPVQPTPELVSAQRTAALGQTLVIGDSTSYRLTGQWEAENGGEPTANLWALRHPTWHVDAVGGRNVNKLDDRIDYYLNNIDSSPAMFIMALGTNPDPDDLWYKSHFLGSLNKFPSTTKVILVIPVRAGTNKGFKGQQVTKYAGWLHEIAAVRNNTIVANWRTKVLNDPTMDAYTGIGEWTNDGMHQKNPFGRDAWMDILDAAVARF